MKFKRAQKIEQKFGSRKLERVRSAHTYRRSILTRRLDYYYYHRRNQYGADVSGIRE